MLHKLVGISFNENWPRHGSVTLCQVRSDLSGKLIIGWHDTCGQVHYYNNTPIHQPVFKVKVEFNNSRYNIHLWKNKRLKFGFFVSNFNHLTHLVKSILTYIWQNTPFFTVLFAVVAGYFSSSITAGCISVFWQIPLPLQYAQYTAPLHCG